MLQIDGSFGEGGGQIVRSSVALAMLTGRAIEVVNVRAGRDKPGLRRQHATAIRAAGQVCGADIEGADVGSCRFVFKPGVVRAGDYRFSIGTAGSTMLVLQTILPALLVAEGTSRVTLEGGTHNPGGPPFDFVERVYVPLINRMGPTVTVDLERCGFYPAGGGSVRVRVEPAAGGVLRGFELHERGGIDEKLARAIVSNLPRHIAERELRKVTSVPWWGGSRAFVEDVPSPGPGNVLTIEVRAVKARELFIAFGRRGVKAEVVAREVLTEARAWIDSDVPVGPHLADQLLLPLAIAGEGAFTTMPLTLHATTHIELIKRFVDVDVTVEEVEGDRRVVRVARR
ncbi:MAG: RNA 3'-terminal phosphate cyclase [Phycisphaera sp.]|nr:RNA 3'-terminal phosphate cyclase [Phycisphaera sp.]